MSVFPGGKKCLNKEMLAVNVARATRQGTECQMDFTLKEKTAPGVREELWISERIWNHIITDTEQPKFIDQKEQKRQNIHTS